MSLILSLYFFFFQAEDGIRDWSVTGVQTCALPISSRTLAHSGLKSWTSAGTTEREKLWFGAYLRRARVYSAAKPFILSFRIALAVRNLLSRVFPQPLKSCLL